MNRMSQIVAAVLLVSLSAAMYKTVHAVRTGQKKEKSTIPAPPLTQEQEKKLDKALNQAEVAAGSAATGQPTKAMRIKRFLNNVKELRHCMKPWNRTKCDPRVIAELKSEWKALAVVALGAATAAAVMYLIVGASKQPGVQEYPDPWGEGQTPPELSPESIAAGKAPADWSHLDYQPKMPSDKSIDSMKLQSPPPSLGLTKEQIEWMRTKGGDPTFGAPLPPAIPEPSRPLTPYEKSVLRARGLSSGGG